MPNVSCVVTDAVAQVRLSRPEKLNALTLDILADLVRVARSLAKDKALRAVVIAGDGDAFCAGLDFATVLKDSRGVAKAFAPVPWRGTNLFQEACWAWRRIPVPVIAAVHGHCLGGGLQIALAADFRIADPDSTWSVLEGKWGIIPDMSGIQSLSELIGIDRAKMLTMTAEMFTGEQAYQMGLVSEMDADPVAAANGLAERFKGRSPDALAAAKRLFNSTWHASARRTFARERIEQVRLLLNPNTKIAREAAFTKVAPVFKPRRR